MSDVVSQARRTIARHRLAAAETRVLVALSGGSDSVALASILQSLAAAGELRLTGLAHFNHQLRPGAGDDEAFCVRFAGSMRLPIVRDRENVGERARRERRSVEETAREARHAFLERARVELDADVIAVGHTRDDQAETFLLRTVRGSGTRGVASMHPQNGAIIRPLLDCRHSELRAYLSTQGLMFVEDETNADVTIPRNRVRHELLPFLEQRFNPAIVDALAAQAELARDEWAWLEAEAERALPHVSRQHAGGWRVAVPELAAKPLALQRVILHRLMTAASGGRPVALQHVESALDLMGRSAGSRDGPGQRLQRRGDSLVLTSRAVDVAGLGGTQLPEFRALPVPGELDLDGRRLTAERAPSADKVTGGLSGRGPSVVVQGHLCSGGLIAGLRVRHRRPGDRFHPLGLGGVKKLQDYFVDLKVPAAERDSVPLVVDGDDRIVWVAGYAVDDRFRVTDPAQAVIILRLNPLGGSA